MCMHIHVQRPWCGNTAIFNMCYVVSGVETLFYLRRRESESSRGRSQVVVN